ncbi:SusC/RagA family TonB-linked outer membrane protein [Aestuariivivens sediminis]|uniref:SusC/RagA family TonB-linked outer membrane protein n=1 Tax=Aestuariivivens sediminis TaxID=2913557 RepID=UPI001F593EE1|nr:SusC/RagA family TonB-linked outer membrane protein [Aestuariivivens sediminis]
MKTKFSGMLALFLVLVVQYSFAQEKTITGTVSDESGLPLPGTTVLIKGTSSGTSADFDGKYAITTTTGSVLVFSFVGYTSQEITVGSANTINVVMQEDAAQLEEVIVTALGIKRKPKELAYATTVVENDAIIQAAPVNAVSALVGKSSGLNVNFSDNGVKPNSTVRLRASNSLTGNNNALIVIDNVPQSSSSLGDINPNDIESVNILKGASSVTLYGSAGANGALIITTKKGSKNEKLNVSINSAVTFEILKFFPESQSEFGSGSTNVFDYTPYENESWGPRYDGTLRQVGPVLADGTFNMLPYAPVRKGRESFFETGITTQNSISISGGDENSTYFFSAQRIDKTGITPGDKYWRDNFRFNATRTYGNLESTTSVAFFQDKFDVAGPSPTDGSFYRILLNTPAHYRLSDYRNWRTDKYSTPETYFNAYFKNPYQIVDQNRDSNRSNRLQAIANLKYTFTDWLSATYSLGGTWFNSERKNTQEGFTYDPTITYTRPSNEVSAVLDATSSNFRLNSDLLFNIEKQINDDFNVRLIVGTHLEAFRSNQMNILGNNLFTDEIFNVNVRTGNLSFNSANFTSPQSNTQKRLYSYLGDLTLGFKDYLFLTGSWRQDTSSTLPVQNNTYDYYSGGLSFVATDAIPGLKGGVLDYLKLNASYAKVGNDAGIGDINENFRVPIGFPFNNPGVRPTTIAVDPNLSPEFSYSTEAGFRAEFFKQRINLDANYYFVKAEDQINFSAASRASGASSYLTNIGEIQNKGVEIDLSVTPIKTEDFRWDVGFTYTFNESEVISLSEGANRIQIGTGFTNTATIFAEVGQPFPSLYAPGYKRDPQGRIIVEANGNPSPTSELVNLGTTVPKIIAGLSTKLEYKGLSLRAVADYKTGHVFYSTLVEILEFAGLTKNSVSTNRQPFIFPNSVYNTGTAENPVYVENTDRPTTDGTRNFWQTSFNEIKENYVVDASAIKIREIAIDYTVPSKYLERTPLTGITVGFVANNLIMWRAKENIYTDPEFSINSGNEANYGIGAGNAFPATNGVTGIGSSDQAPPTGTYGFKMSLKF